MDDAPTNVWHRQMHCHALPNGRIAEQRTQNCNAKRNSRMHTSTCTHQYTRIQCTALMMTSGDSPVKRRRGPPAISVLGGHRLPGPRLPADPPPPPTPTPADPAPLRRPSVAPRRPSAPHGGFEAGRVGEVQVSARYSPLGGRGQWVGALDQRLGLKNTHSSP